MWGHPNNRKLTGKSFAVRVDSRSKDAEGKYDASPLLQRHTDQTELQLSSLIPDQTYVMTVFENAPDFPQMELRFVQSMRFLLLVSSIPVWTLGKFVANNWMYTVYVLTFENIFFDNLWISF